MWNFLAPVSVYARLSRSSFLPLLIVVGKNSRKKRRDDTDYGVLNVPMIIWAVYEVCLPAFLLVIMEWGQSFEIKTLTFLLMMMEWDRWFAYWQVFGLHHCHIIHYFPCKSRTEKSKFLSVLGYFLVHFEWIVMGWPSAWTFSLPPLWQGFDSHHLPVPSLLVYGIL